jgi:hypothetical protein
VESGIIPLVLGGPTTVDQGRLYCSRHHHRIHDQLERTQRLRE